MVLPLIAGAAISAGSSILGGLLNRGESRRLQREQNEYNKPTNIRARAEDAGFNPLLFVGPGVGNQTGIVQSGFGDSIANAGLALASGMADQAKQDAYESELQKQNADLRKALDTATLRPKVAGVFGTAQPVTVPDIPVPASSASGGRYPDRIDVTGRVEEPDPLWSGLESDGEVTWVPAGDVDLDDLAVGLGIAGWNKAKAWWHTGQQQLADRGAPPPVKKHPRDGSPLPGQWVWQNTGRAGNPRWVWRGE